MCGIKDRITQGSGFWVLVSFLELLFWKDGIASGKGFWILWFGTFSLLVVLFCFLLFCFAGAFVLPWCVVLSFVRCIVCDVFFFCMCWLLCFLLVAVPFCFLLFAALLCFLWCVLAALLFACCCAVLFFAFCCAVMLFCVFVVVCAGCCVFCCAEVWAGKRGDCPWLAGSSRVLSREYLPTY